MDSNALIIRDESLVFSFCILLTVVILARICDNIMDCVNDEDENGDIADCKPSGTVREIHVVPFLLMGHSLRKFSKDKQGIKFHQ